MKIQENSGFSLIEMLIGIALVALIALGGSQMMLRSQQAGNRDSLRKNYSEISQDLTTRMNHLYKRHVSKTLNGPQMLTLTLPSGPVTIETICEPNGLDFQAPDALLARCKSCGSGQRQVVRISSNGTTQVYPGANQRTDLPAAASVCFKNGADPDEVELIVEFLVVDPVDHTKKNVSKIESLLVRDISKVSEFE